MTRSGLPATSVTTLTPSGPLVPVVASLPHGGTYVPPRYGAALRVPAHELWSDWHTTQLYGFTPQLGIITVQARWSRFVADPNRSPDRALFGPFGRGIVSSTGVDGAQLYPQPPTEAELQERLATAYHPYHRAVDAAVEVVLDVFGHALLLDLHSFGMPVEADVVLGDGHGTTASTAAVGLVATSCRRHGLSVATNDPFPGGWIVRRFADRPEVDAVQVELSQRRYLDPDDAEHRRWPPPVVPTLMADGQRTMRGVLSDLTRRLRREGGQRTDASAG